MQKIITKLFLGWKVMQVINLELVHNYINGVDTAPYDISELEDNPSFMKVVLLATKVL